MGTSTDIITEDEEYTWTCVSGDEETQCEAYVKAHGSCGISSNVTLPTNYNEEELCNIGELASKNQSNGSLSWTCRGIGDGYDAQCSANIQTYGVCGGSHGGEFTSFPTSNLCSVGDSINNQNTSTGYTWQCSGIHGGNTKNCSANKETSTNIEISPEIQECLDAGTNPTLCFSISA